MGTDFFIRRYPLIIMAAVFAAILWVYVTLRGDYQAIVSVDLSITNIPTGFAIKSPVPPTVQVRINTTGWHLAMLRWRGTPRVEIDGGGAGRDRIIDIGKILPGAMALPPDVQVLDVNPERILVETEPVSTKKVVIEPRTDLRLRPGYIQVGVITSTPDSVVISGARSVLADIHSVRTRTVVESDVFSPMQVTAVLEDSFDVPITLSTTSASLSWDVEPFAEKTFRRIPIELTEVPTNRTVVLLPSMVDVTLRGGVSQLARITDQEITASVQYRTILADTTGVIQPAIVSPAWTTVVAVKPERIQYVIRKH